MNNRLLSLNQMIGACWYLSPLRKYYLDNTFVTVTGTVLFDPCSITKQISVNQSQSGDRPLIDSVPPKQISRIHFVFYIIQHCFVAVGDDGIAAFLKSFYIVDYQGAEECGSFGQCRLVDDDGSAFCFDPFHDSLDAALPKVIAVCFHCKAVYAYGYRSFFFHMEFAV